MRSFIKLGSYFFHPIWMPVLGAILYFLITPKFFHPSLIQIKLLGLAILTIFIPLLFLLILKNMRIIRSFQLKDVKERRLPLLFFCVMTTLVLNYVLNSFHFVELYYFFAGVLFSSLTSFILSLFKVKISLHLIGITGLCTFIIVLSIFYERNLIFLIAFLVFSIGWTASSRLQEKAHLPLELLLGFFIGFVPQFMLLQYWF